MARKTIPDYTIIVPVFNEQKNIEKLVVRIFRALKKTQKSYSVIFIDDHSTDKTYQKLQRLSNKYPIEVYLKQGQRGKAYSIIEGAGKTGAKTIIMIDGDLQYPPEELPRLIEENQKFDVVIGGRDKSGLSTTRKLASLIFQTFFGKLLHGFSFDVQSGLKLFPRSLLLTLNISQISPWTLDLPLLIAAKEKGYSITEIKIPFRKRLYEKSKIDLLTSSKEIALSAIRLKFSPSKIYPIKPTSHGMIGAGYLHKGKYLITHSTLPIHHSAYQTLVFWQKIILWTILGGIVLGAIIAPLGTAIIIVAILSLVYFADSLFNLFVILKSLHNPPELVFKRKEIKSLSDSQLPVYTILCPLYKETAIIPQFIKALSAISWPKHKLEVLFLLEEDDLKTRHALAGYKLPPYIKVIIVPDSRPKTKPKACNFGLSVAKGEYLVIYDAEDIPDPLQLKKAYLAFKKLPADTVCLQAKLNYFNSSQNLLTRFFTAEYSLWFDIILTGLQSINTAIPLGGTSNHFKTAVLRNLKGWDPFNVTEDCDLGMRLFKMGYKTAVFDSTTLEEANSQVKNWLRQRSRWIKGYMQTYLVHMRNPFDFIGQKGIHAFVFQLIIGARISFILINPFLWVMTISYFLFHTQTASFIESLYPKWDFYLAVTSLVFGNFIYIYNYMIGSAKKEEWGLIKFVYLIPLYWLMASVAAYLALYQLITKPHYWEKTNHGLHLQKSNDLKQSLLPPSPNISGTRSVLGTISGSIFKQKKLIGGGLFLVTSNLIVNIANFVFNTYLGRMLTFEDFGVLSLFVSFFNIAGLFLNSLTVSVTQKIAFFVGRYSRGKARHFLIVQTGSTFLFASLLTFAYILLIPQMEEFFHISSALPFILFAPIGLISPLSYSISGFMYGTLSFKTLGIMMISDSAGKLLSVYLLILFHLEPLVVSALFIGQLLQLGIGFISISKVKPDKTLTASELRFDKSFYLASIINGISTLSFLGIDVLLAKHFLSSFEAGEFGVLSLIGKITFFFGSLFVPFLIPLVSKNEGAKRDSSFTLAIIFGATLLLCLSAFVILGIFGNLSVTMLFGAKGELITPYLWLYTLTIALFTLTVPFINYYQAKKNYLYSGAGLMLCLGQIIFVSLFHNDLDQFIRVLFYCTASYCILFGLLFLNRRRIPPILANIKALLSLFYPLPKTVAASSVSSTPAMRILIFNWRDTKHSWAGGAEVYLMELAKRWVKNGHEVTLFCGNDGSLPGYSQIEGVTIIRRGGFYSVYIWAILYYLLRFRGKFDIIIDSENGIPFFTPLFTNHPKFLLIHHIHQEVFHSQLKFPFSLLAIVLESKLMPFVYKRQKIVTVSESSKREIIKMNLAPADEVDIVTPGVDLDKSLQLQKSPDPNFVYLGRLKPYKNIDIALKAFAKISAKYPAATFSIAGNGESLDSLKALTVSLKLNKSVRFLGRVSEKKKMELLAKSWAMVQPSMIEGWGITVIEANACGTPVIASNVAGLKDSVLDQKTGLLIKPGNIESCAQAMERLITNSYLRRKLSKNASGWAQNFSWDKSANRFLQVIEEKTYSSREDFLPSSVGNKGEIYD